MVGNDGDNVRVEEEGHRKTEARLKEGGREEKMTAREHDNGRSKRKIHKEIRKHTNSGSRKRRKKGKYVHK